MIVKLAPILGITFIDILGFSILIPLMPFYVQKFGGTPIVLGALFSTFAVCQLIAGPLWGNISDRIGRKRVLIVSQIGATIGWTMLAFAPTIAIVFLARIIEGISGGNISVTQSYVADVVEPEQRGRAYAYIGAAFSAGMIFGPATGGLLAHHFGFATPFLLAAALQVLTLIVTIVALPESLAATNPDDERPPAASFADIVHELRDPAVAPVLWQKLLFSLALYGWFACFTLILQRQLSLTEDTASYAFAVFGVMSVISQLGITPRLIDKVGARAANTIGMVLTALSFATVPFMHDVPTALVMLALFSLGLSINGATIAALIGDAAPAAMRGTIFGVSSSLESASGVVMPPISTATLMASGGGATAMISLVLSLGALAIGIRQPRRAPFAAKTE